MNYDFENFMSDIKDIMTTHLNTKIAEISTEKNDSISLPLIDDDAYFWQSLDGKQINYNPFVWYGISDIGSQPTQASYSRTHSPLTVDAIIVLADNGEDVNITSKVYRYMRAMKEIFEENFELKRGIKLQVQSLVPIEISLINDSYSHKACGVSLKADIA